MTYDLHFKLGRLRLFICEALCIKYDCDLLLSPTHFMVGKQRHVPHNFEEYVRVASGKVGLDVSDVSKYTSVHPYPILLLAVVPGLPNLS